MILESIILLYFIIKLGTANKFSYKCILIFYLKMYDDISIKLYIYLILYILKYMNELLSMK